MGMTMRAIDEAPAPRPVEITIACEGMDDSLFGCGAKVGPEILEPGTHPWAVGHRQGWLVDQDRTLCPRCRP